MGSTKISKIAKAFNSFKGTIVASIISSCTVD